VKKLASDSIEVTGTVASVIEHYREAAVNIVPLRIGGGTRLKIYEAMAMGKATVSTSVGAEGLDVHDGSDILLADSAEKFGESLISLLTNEQVRKRIEESAAEQAAKYDWSVITRQFEEVLAAVASRNVRAALRGRPSLEIESRVHQEEAATEGRPHLANEGLLGNNELTHQGGAATEGRPYTV
jgi:hypothetical protein